MPFDSPDVNLGELLKDVGSGKVQLPDFQRKWKWDSDRIKSLLASISMGYPVGVVMMLEVGGTGVRFAPIPIDGVDSDKVLPPDRLILDGQQRLTSLFQSMMSGAPVNTTDAKGKRMKRWYYIDMTQALDPGADRDDAIVSVPEDRRIRDNFGRTVVTDLSSTELECAAEMYPLAGVFDVATAQKWMFTYATLDKAQTSERLERWKDFTERVLQNITSYTVPVIVLKKETPKEAVCTVFEKVNTGGIALNVFELLTATFAAEPGDVKLNREWEQYKVRLGEHRVLRSIENTDFLQSITLLATLDRRQAHLSAGRDPAQVPGVGCRRKDVLKLTVNEYRRWAEPVIQALEWAASFLADERIFQAADLPYRTQLVPLSAIHVALGNHADTIGNVAKVRQWYWCGVLGELYGGTTETRFAKDVVEVVDWVNGAGELPSTVTEAVFSPARLLTLRTRNSAAYKGIYALLMRGGCLDWLKERDIDLVSFFPMAVDIHHVFPKKWCDDHRIDERRRESIANKTPLAAETNRIIGSRGPLVYLPLLEQLAMATESDMDSRLKTHAIEPSCLRSDDFDGFFLARSEALLKLISQAMGKEVIRETLAEMSVEADQYDLEPAEPDDAPESLSDA